MQTFFKSALDNLVFDSISGGFSVYELQDDFGVNITGFEGIPDWVATALDIGSSAAGAIEGAPGIAVDVANTFIQGALEGAASADDYQSADAKDQLYAALKSYFTSFRQFFEDTLLTAVGGGGDPSTLPAQGNCPDDQACQSPIAGFMSDGRFLLEGEHLDQLTDSSWPVLQKKLVDVGESPKTFKCQNSSDTKSVLTGRQHSPRPAMVSLCALS